MRKRPSEIGRIASGKIIYGNHPLAFGQQSVREVRANKAGAAGDEGTRRLGLRVRDR